jgi:6,7-dimethyl-8-ribityllumazine synthase
MTGNPTHYSAHLDAKGLKFALVVSRYNGLVTKELLDGALDAIERHGGSRADQSVFWAPGAFEIPFIAKMALQHGNYDGVIALGCIMKGQTTNNDLIAGEVVKGLFAIGIEYDVAVGFGVLTPETLEQALDRAGMKMGNKGAEAALAAIEVARLALMLKK